MFDEVLERSAQSLKSYLQKLLGKNRVRVVVVDLSETYRLIAKKHFPNAMIVADRFHVIRLVNQQFVKTWAELDDLGRKHRGLLERRWPADKEIKPIESSTTPISRQKKPRAPKAHEHPNQSQKTRTHYQKKEDEMKRKQMPKGRK